MFNGQSPKIIRILWLCWCFLGMLEGIWFIICLTQQYFQYSVVTAIASARSVTTALPVVTFCNFNFFNADAGKQFLNSSLTEFANLDIYTANKGMFAKSKIKLYQIRLKYAKSSLLKNNAVYSNKCFLKSLGMTLQDMMLSCYFGSQPCSFSNFEYYYDLNYGNCYKFNTGLNGFNQSVPLQQVITPGENSGL